jgi:hypothetical protein
MMKRCLGRSFAIAAQTLVLAAVLVLFMPANAAFAAEQAEMEPKVTLRLWLDDADPSVTGFWLAVENRGKSTVRLIRPRQGMIELYQRWGGWTLTVTGPGGNWEPLPETGIIVGPAPDDCIELKPWESFAVRIDIGSWHCVGGKAGEGHVRLMDRPGVYQLQVGYAALEDPFYLRVDKATAKPPTPLSGLRSAAFAITVPASVKKER